MDGTTKQERAKETRRKNEDNMYYNYMTQVDALRQQMEKEAEEKMQQQILLAQENEMLKQQRANGSRI